MTATSRATPLNSWEFQCIHDIESGSKVCTTEMHLMESGVEFVLYFAHTHKGTSPFVAIGDELPFQVMQVQVDDKEPILAETCETGTCFFDKSSSRLLLSQFKKGGTARITISAPNNTLLDREVTLLGFSAAYGQFR